MSAFSRGCLLRQQLAVKIPRNVSSYLSNSCHQPRHFSASALLFAAKKPRPSSSPRPKPLPPKLIPKIKPSYTPLGPALASTPTTSPTTTTTPLPKYISYETTLAQKPHSTLLYEAPSHTAFMLTSYTSATFCLSYAGIAFYSNALYPPAGLDSWIPIAFSGICTMMAALGGWFALSPTRIIKRITAVPVGVAGNPGLGMGMGMMGATGNGNGATPGTPELRIEVELKKMFPMPFFPPRIFSIPPSQLLLSSRLLPSGTPKPSPSQHLANKRAEMETHRKELEYERSHLLTSPMRHASRAFYGAFKELQRAFTRQGFMKVEVGGKGGGKGQVYKLDVNGGWALDGGRALDRLARVKGWKGVD